MIKQPSSPEIEVGSVQKEGKKERPGIQNALILEDFKIPFFVFFSPLRKRLFRSKI